MRIPFTKKTKDFYQMLSDHASKTEEGLVALSDFVHTPTPYHGDRINKLEQEADDLRRGLIDELNKTFITPIDREDIFALSRAIDDVIDYAKSTAEEILLFEAKPDGHIKEMVSILCGATRDMASGVRHLEHDPQKAAEHIIRAKKAENKIEHKYREGLAQLFSTNDVVQILKTREIYRHLSNAADRVVEAADIVSDVLVKNA